MDIPTWVTQMIIRKEYRWSMAHRLPRHDSQCKNVHGHSYKLAVSLKRDLNDGMVMDFHELNLIVEKNVLDKVDHSLAVSSSDEVLIKFIEENKDMKHVVLDCETTCEEMAKTFWRWLSPELKLDKIEVFESEVSGAVYGGEDE